MHRTGDEALEITPTTIHPPVKPLRGICRHLEIMPVIPSLRSRAGSERSEGMTGLDLAGGEELSSSFEPCLRKAKRHQSKRSSSRCDRCLHFFCATRPGAWG